MTARNTHVKNQGWVKLQDHNYTGADAVKLTGDQSAAGHKTWTGLATFGQRHLPRQYAKR